MTDIAELLKQLEAIGLMDQLRAAQQASNAAERDELCRQHSALRCEADEVLPPLTAALERARAAHATAFDLWASAAADLDMAAARLAATTGDIDRRIERTENQLVRLAPPRLQALECYLRNDLRRAIHSAYRTYETTVQDFLGARPATASNNDEIDAALMALRESLSAIESLKRQPHEATDSEIGAALAGLATSLAPLGLELQGIPAAPSPTTAAAPKATAPAGWLGKALSRVF